MLTNNPNIPINVFLYWQLKRCMYMYFVLCTQYFTLKRDWVRVQCARNEFCIQGLIQTTCHLEWCLFVFKSSSPDHFWIDKWLFSINGSSTFNILDLWSFYHILQLCIFFKMSLQWEYADSKLSDHNLGIAQHCGLYSK